MRAQDAVPRAEPRRETALLAAALGSLQDPLEDIQILKPQVAALNRQAPLDLFVLLNRDRHPQRYSQQWMYSCEQALENTPIPANSKPVLIRVQ